MASPVVSHVASDIAPVDRLEQLDAILGRIEDDFARHRPKEPISARGVTLEQGAILPCGRWPTQLEQNSIGSSIVTPTIGWRLQARQPAAIGRKSRYRTIKAPAHSSWRESYEQPARSVFAAQSMEEALRELAGSAEPEDGDADLLDLERQLALLHLMAAAPLDSGLTLIWIRGHPAGSPCPSAEQLCKLFLDGWRDGLAVEIELPRDLSDVPPSDRILLIKGIHARSLAMTEAGTHLFCPTHGNVVPLRVDVIDSWPVTPADPFAFGPVLRIYVAGNSTIDLRTGLVAPTGDAAAMRTFAVAGLPARKAD